MLTTTQITLGGKIMKYIVYEYKGDYENDGGRTVWNHLAKKQKLKDANGKTLFFKCKKEVYQFMTYYRGLENIYDIEKVKEITMQNGKKYFIPG